jgi:hypothetical protein
MNLASSAAFTVILSLITQEEVFHTFNSSGNLAGKFIGGNDNLFLRFVSGHRPRALANFKIQCALLCRKLIAVYFSLELCQNYMTLCVRIGKIDRLKPPLNA